jgi:hypothetical protein
LLRDVAQPARASHTARARVSRAARRARDVAAFAARPGALGLAALLAASLGCSTASQVPGGEAGVDGGTDGEPTPCIGIGAQVCQGDVVHACLDGKLGAPIQSCPTGTCSLGRCATPTCATAEANRTGFLGCLFYVFEADNVTSDAPLPTSLLVTNPSATDSASVTLQVPGAGNGGATTWTFDSEVTVGPGAAARIFLVQQEVRGVALTPRSAVRLTSGVPITVALVQSDDRDQSTTSSSAGTMVLPAQTIGAHYRVMTYTQVATDAVATWV